MESFGERTPRALVISGASSSSGKTTIACGLLRALNNRGLSFCAYKTGPDYIDTEYLRQAGKCEAYNLDTWLMNEDSTRELFATTSYDKDLVIIEGAMGLYDGDTNSTASIAKLLGVPVVLVINAKSIGESAAALAYGFREYDKDINLAGVILNNVGSDSHEKIITEALNRVGVKCFGALRRNDEFAIPERHLGLITSIENKAFDFESLALEIEARIDLDELIQRAAPQSFYDPHPPALMKFSCGAAYHVAVARDEAFSFYYPESLEALKNLGASLEFFSPLHDKVLPEADIYIFGGGFPEIFESQLRENLSMIKSVRHCNKKIYAECGGLMYLCKNLAGVIPFTFTMTDKPVIGYIEARALRDNIICGKDTLIRGHEFHYSRVEPEFHENTCAFELTRPKTGSKYFGGYANGNILASYLHVNFFGNIALAKNLLNKN